MILFAATAASGQDKFSRGIEVNTFVPKGQIIAGLSTSYSQSNFNDYQFLIIEGINADTYSFKISPILCYMFADNLGAGGRFGYSRSRSKLNKADVVMSSEDSYSVENLYNISQKFSGMAILRQYINLGKTKRFGIFMEMQGEFGYGNTKITSGRGDDFTGSFSTDYSIDIGLAPGMVCFLNNYSAIEVNVGVLGFGYTHRHIETDRIHVADLKTKAANFKVNLFSISFGVSFYL